MPAEPPRRLGLADALILVAATAFGLAGAREYRAGVELMRTRTGLPRAASVVLVDRMRAATMVLGAWTPAVLLIRLRRPRPRLRRIAREPGMAACAASAAAMAVQAVIRGLQSGWLGGMGGIPLWYWVARDIPLTVTFAIVGAWLTLALSGLWRPRSDGVDRLGRAVGVLWGILFMGEWGLIIFRW